MKHTTSRVSAIVAGAATLALLGGVGGATATGLITGAQIKDQSIRSIDIASGGVGSSEIRNGSVYPSDLNPSTRTALTGQTGAPGAKGADGTNGVNGKDGTNGTNGTDGKDGDDGTNGVSGYEVRTWDYDQVSGGGIATMTCPVGKVALGGGYWFKDDASMTDGLAVVRSMPGRMDWSTNTPIEGDNRGWIVQPNKPENVNPGALTVYVTCANVG